jgi:putative NIF3 family GTP cyclohydrolase 1 type 2
MKVELLRKSRRFMFLHTIRPRCLFGTRISNCTSQISLNLTLTFGRASVQHTRVPIEPKALDSHPGAGMGRIVRFKEKQPLSSLIDRIARGLGNPKGFPVAIPQSSSLDDIHISSVGICAGSGGSLLSPLRDVDLLFTGEMSHHEALAAIERGQCVIALFHSNTERGFLQDVLRDQLRKAVAEEWESVRREEAEREDVSEEFMEALKDNEVDVAVSKRDRDPYGIVLAAGD